MANTDRARKLLIRSALATSTTIATLVGAQSFAMLDARQFQLPEAPEAPIAESEVVLAPVIVPTQTPVLIAHSAPEIEIIQAAPSIIILRQAGEVNTTQTLQTANVAKTVIQPPAPSELAAPPPVIVPAPAPQPVIIQQPAPQRSRSSR